MSERKSIDDFYSELKKKYPRRPMSNPMFRIKYLKKKAQEMYEAQRVKEEDNLNDFLNLSVELRPDGPDAQAFSQNSKTDAL